MRRSPVRTAAGLLVLAPLLAACAAGSASTAGGPAGSGQIPSFDDPLTATAAPSASMTPAPTTASTPPRGLSLAWKLEGVSGDDRRLYLKYVAGDGDCVSFAGFTLSETASSVSVTATGRTDQSKQDCASVLRLQEGYVQLSERLGHRTLVHPPVASEWSTVF